MKIELHNNKDFWAGLFLLGLGGAAVFFARDYQFGSVLSMGPGFFPTILGGILMAFGLSIIIMGILNNEKITEHLSFRAMIILPLALVLFGILINSFGFIPAMAALIFLSASAGSEFKLIEVLLLTILMTLITAAVFIWGLSLPYPLIKGF